MRKVMIYTDKAPKPSGAYSQAVKLGEMVYLAGTCPFDTVTGEVLFPGDMEQQTRIVLEYMGEILQAAGTSLEHVVKVTSFIDDLNEFEAYNRTYRKFFQEEPPARSTIEIGKFPTGMRVEIECIAYIPS
ncbi:RidA family protein [Cohnella abietis]|uniref:Reactive intermediate/imine deaminase n=1 Tax=Cohnella abietis TaxID=2507935 RepID=A0A3T1D778_9BACL|nr:Rid family detoxifying hydrolase [Cohnella abietis]BBI33899.1 reactive intermediate/imine deaminase [Cohnella abietis]